MAQSIERCYPKSRHASRSETWIFTTAYSTRRRRQAEFKNFHEQPRPKPPSQASNPRRPCAAAHSPFRGPSIASPDCSSGHRAPPSNNKRQRRLRQSRGSPRQSVDLAKTHRPTVASRLALQLLLRHNGILQRSGVYFREGHFSEDRSVFRLALYRTAVPSRYNISVIGGGLQNAPTFIVRNEGPVAHVNPPIAPASIAGVSKPWIIQFI